MKQLFEKNPALFILAVLGLLYIGICIGAVSTVAVLRMKTVDIVGKYETSTATNENGDVKIGIVTDENDPMRSVGFGLKGRNVNTVIFPDGEPKPGERVYMSVVYYYTIFEPNAMYAVFTVHSLR